MPIYRIRTIYWMYRSQLATFAVEIAGGLLWAAAVIQLRRKDGGRKKENHDHGRGSSRGRQSEFAHGGSAWAGGLRRFSAVRKDGALQPGENPGACGAREGFGRIRAFRLYERGDHSIHHGKAFQRRRQEDAYFHPLFDSGWRKGFGGH